MGAIFAKVIPSIIALESGYQNGENDHGGETKYGISKRQFPQVDIASLTESDAMALLEECYWQQYHLDRIDDQNIANQIFLLFINMNPIHAARIVQFAINAGGSSVTTVKVDGVLGSKTIQTLNILNSRWLSDRIRVEACRYYLAETDADKSQIPNFRGWIRRALT